MSVKVDTVTTYKFELSEDTAAKIEALISLVDHSKHEDLRELYGPLPGLYNTDVDGNGAVVLEKV